MGVEWHKSILDVAKHAAKFGIVIYGAGFWGKIALQVLQIWDIEKIVFCDDDKKKQGMTVNERKVISLEEAAVTYGEAVYIVCIDETKKGDAQGIICRRKMLQRLKDLNLYSRHSEIHIAYYLFLLEINISLLNTEEATIQEANAIKPEQLNKIILFNNMSNSGAYYFEQLLDGHPDIVFLPYIESLEKVYVKRLRFLEGKELIIEIMAQLMGYFQSQYNGLYMIGQHRFQGYCLTQEGDYTKDVYIDPELFLKQLVSALGKSIKIDSYAHLLKILFAAYNNCLGKKNNSNKEFWIFYHIHLPDFRANKMYESLNPSEFERIESIIIIREPLQHLNSWIKRFVLQQKNIDVAAGDYFKAVLLSDMGIMLQKCKEYSNIKAVRFEDLKNKNLETLQAICKWLNIKFYDIMSKTTLNGIEVYFPVIQEGKIKYITGNDISAIKQNDFSQVMTKYDEFRLKVIFSKFRNAFNYAEIKYDFSELDIDKFLEEEFLFCKLIKNLMKEKQLTISEQNAPDIQVRNIFKEYLSTYTDDIQYYDYIH